MLRFAPFKSIGRDRRTRVPIFYFLGENAPPQAEQGFNESVCTHLLLRTGCVYLPSHHRLTCLSQAFLHANVDETFVARLRHCCRGIIPPSPCPCISRFCSLMISRLIAMPQYYYVASSVNISFTVLLLLPCTAEYYKHNM